MAQVTYINKVENSGATDDGKVSAANMNELKSVINTNEAQQVAADAATLTSANNYTDAKNSSVNYFIQGAGGMGYISKANQSIQPTAVIGTVKYYNDSASKFSYARRNIANTADIRMSFASPDLNTDIIFPTTTTGSDSVAYLGTAQTYSAINTFNAAQNIKSVNILDFNGVTWMPALTVGSSSNVFKLGLTANEVQVCNLMPLSVGNTQLGEFSRPFGSLGAKGMACNVSMDFYSGNILSLRSAAEILLITDDSGSNSTKKVKFNSGNFTFATASNGSYNSGDFVFISGNTVNTNITDVGTTGWFIFDSGTVAMNQKRGNFQLFGGSTPVNSQGMQRGVYLGNATTEPSVAALNGSFIWNFAGKTKFSGSVALPFVGSGIEIKEGTNATMGLSTLSAGTVTVSTTKVTANSRIQCTTNGGTLTNVGTVYISARTAGTSFTISSLNLLDSSDVAWVIFEPN